MENKYIGNLVSIIIPVYNAERFLAKTIDSVIAQSYRPIEILLVNDCSTDNSEKVIREYQDKYPELVIYIKLEKNSGVSVARNAGIKRARGQYIAFQDSDDLWKKDKLSMQIELLKKTNAPLCYTAIEMIDTSDEVIKTKRKVTETISYGKLLRNTMIATSSAVINRNITGNVFMPKSRSTTELYSMAEDYDTWLKITKKYGDAVGINKALVQYRIVKGGLSTGKLKSFKRVYRAQTQLEHIPPFNAFVNCMFYAANGLKKHLF